ncbi:hypothetical protein NMY22_g17420 [Coprinellus aureogranulatus]|nr:hypothetical protein NMY22_g17420 [Coprinellus aureogranulatus]
MAPITADFDRSVRIRPRFEMAPDGRPLIKAFGILQAIPRSGVLRGVRMKKKEDRRLRWYNCTSGKDAGALQGWNGTADSVLGTPMNKQHKCIDKEDAQYEFLTCALENIDTIRSESHLVHGIPGISNLVELRAWVTMHHLD